MKVCTCFVLFRIFAHTILISGIKQKGDLRSVYLTKDKVPESSNIKYPGDKKDLDNGTNLITNKNKISKNNLRAQRPKTFTGFIVEAIKVLNTYGDTAFEDFFHILDGELSSNQYRGGKFSELIKNDDFRQLLSSTFNMIKEQPVSETRGNMHAMADSIRDETCDENVKTLLDYINTLYGHAEDKFQNVLVDLKHYKNSKSIRSHIKLQKLIRYGVRTILYDHYNELDHETRQELKEKIQTFWESKKKSTSSTEMHNIPAVSKTGMNNVNIVEKFMNAYVGPEVLSEKADKEEGLSSGEASDERSQDKTTPPKTEKIEASSDESGQQIINYTSSELLTGESFDISSNSIKKSQERHELFNTQRYMTLYTEELTFKTTTKKTKIVLRAANATTIKPRVQRRPTTTSTHSFKDTSVKIMPEKMGKLRTNLDMERRPKPISTIKHSSKDTSVKIMSEKMEKLRTNPDTERLPKSTFTTKDSSEDISIKIMPNKMEKLRTNPDTERRPKYTFTTKDSSEDIPIKILGNKMEKLSANLNTERRPKTTSTTKHSPEEISVKILPEKMEKLRPNLEMDSGTIQDMSSHSSDDSHNGLSLQTNYQLMVEQNPDKELKYGKPTVITRSAVNGKNAGMFIQDDAVRQTKSVPVKTIIHSKTKQRQAKTIPQTRTLLRKPPTRYLKPYESNDRTQIGFKKSTTVSRFPNEGLSEKKFITNKPKYPIRRTGNDSNIDGKIFNEYVIKRLDALEKELKELKQVKDLKVEDIKETVKEVADIKHTMANLIQENENERDTEEGPVKTEPLNAVNKQEVNATVIKDTAKNNDTSSDTMTADKETTANVLTSTVDTVTIEDTTDPQTVATTAINVATSDYPDSETPSYYQQQRMDHLGFFEHVNDGLDLGIM